jgi:uncharacterized protein CbrC (UPF0167 family)
MLEQELEVGNIVMPTVESKYHLHSGSSSYDSAVVISVKPFVLASVEADMRWEATIKKEDFVVIANAPKDMLKKCLKRIKK